MDPSDIERLTGLKVYPKSVSEAGDAVYFLGRRGLEKLLGTIGDDRVAGQTVGMAGGRPVIVGPTDHANAHAVRAALPWTAPRLVGLSASLGLGDRLGIATPGHVRAVRGSGLAPVLAQQSIREMARTKRTPQQVIDCATWGVLQEGFRDGFGADADHLQKPEDIDATIAAGFTMFTIDPGAHVDGEADALAGSALTERYDGLDFEALETTGAELRGSYVGREFALTPGGQVAFDEDALLRAAVKYGRAIAHTVLMFRHLVSAAPGQLELEVSVDETESPTSPAEHYFFAAEMQRLGVQWVSLAPRFVGRFEKGVDYIGDLDVFRRAFTEHVGVMRTLGPYKISVHSGSDKFSIYPIVAELTDGLAHVKTAGTSYLEALRALGQIDPPLFREILDFALGRYETDKATYHVSAHVSKVPHSAALSDEKLPPLLDDFDAREVLHVTFGSVLTADDGERFRKRIYDGLRAHEETHYAALTHHLGRHVAGLRRS